MSSPPFNLAQCTAVITGASSGLGAEFARQLAPHATALVLVARRADALEAVKAEVQRPGLTVHCLACDLATDTGRASFLSQFQALGLHPNLLINNAGMGDYGTFASGDEARTRAQIDLNITALISLTHALIPQLQAPAGILNVSSLAGVVPMPELAVYGATKAFVTSFSEALAVELRDQHIVVTALCPGPTPTHFGKNARRPGGEDTNRQGQDLLRVPPDFVVREGLRALTEGRTCIYPGTGVSLAATLFRLMPRALMRAVLRRRLRQAKK